MLHLVGIPWTILGVLLIPVYTCCCRSRVFLFALAVFVGGFVLQFLGHALDGTEPGEIRGLRVWWARRRAADRGGRAVGLPDGGRPARRLTRTPAIRDGLPGRRERSARPDSR